MELKQLQRLVAVVDEGSLAAAARTLGLTQQALSASVAKLEQDLSVTLLDRAPGGITRMTPFGAALLPFARSQLAADRRARAALEAIADADVGTVTVGIGETFAGDIIAEAFIALHESRPGLRVNLIEGYSEILLKRFYQGEFDFVAVGVEDYSLKPGYRAETIYTTQDVIACRPGHPLTHKSALTLKDLEGYGWLVPYSRPSDTDVIIDTFVAENLTPPTQFIGSDAYRVGMKILASSDLLLMTSPALVANRFVNDAYRVLPINRPTIRRKASLVLDNNRPLTPAAKTMLENVRACVGQARFVQDYHQPAH
ncbi:MAG: LysR family transcriptional regulator [Lysobacterales bacterium]